MHHRGFGIKTIMISYVSVDTHVYQRTHVNNNKCVCTYIRAYVSWYARAQIQCTLERKYDRLFQLVLPCSNVCALIIYLNVAFNLFELRSKKLTCLFKSVAK